MSAQSGRIRLDTRSSGDFGSAPVSDQITFWLQLVAYLIVAIFSVMQGYEAYGTGSGEPLPQVQQYSF